MPRSYKRKRSRKRSFKSTRRRKRRKFRVRQGIGNGLPSGMRLARLRCSYQGSVNTGPLVQYTHIYANHPSNPFDYDIQPGGTIPRGYQPLYYDTYANLFKKAMVVGSKATWYVTPTHSQNNNTGQSSQILCGTYLSKQQLPFFSNYTAFVNARRGSMKAVSYQRNSTVVKSHYSMKKFWNIKDVKDNQDDFAVNSLDNLANPARTAFFIIWAQNQDPNDTREGTLGFTVVMDMTICFSVPRDREDLPG